MTRSAMTDLLTQPGRIAGLAIALLLLGAPATADPVDDYVTQAMARQHVPGAALAVIRRGVILRAQGYGIANLEHSVPVHPDTLFKSGAVGMQFTAAAVMLLVEDGRIGLDDSVRRFLPDAPRSWQPITIRQLLNHVSGLPATPNGEFRTDYTDDQLLGIIYRQDLNFPAGTRWRFSYTDYIVLGFIVRRVTGMSYAELLRTRVFEQLGMRTAQPIDEQAVIPNRASGYEWREGRWRHPDWVSPTANSTADGTLYLSALDYAAWAAGLSRGAVLSPTSWALVGTPVTLRSGRTYPYGFGWFLEKEGGHVAWRHAGSWQGFRSAIIRYPGEELTVVALLNADSGDAEEIARHVAGMIDPGLARPPAAPIPEDTPQVGAFVTQLLRAIAAGTADPRAFTAVSKLDFTEMMAEYRATLQPLGALREVAPFGRGEAGNDHLHRYRARYDQGVVEVRLGYAPNGRIGSFDLAPVTAWDAPLEP